MKITFAQALCLTFIILKLCNVINWSWWWVTDEKDCKLKKYRKDWEQKIAEYKKFKKDNEQ